MKETIKKGQSGLGVPPSPPRFECYDTLLKNLKKRKIKYKEITPFNENCPIAFYFHCARFGGNKIVYFTFKRKKYAFIFNDKIIMYILM